MMVRVKDILKSLNLQAPFSLAEPWDNVGLLVGSPELQVTAVLAGLDPKNSLVDEAISQGANTIITHHPVIFKPLQTIDTTDPIGKLLQKALANNIALIASHTNFDNAREGVSNFLVLQLGLEKLSPLVPAPADELAHTGMGRVGFYPAPVGTAAFFSRVLDTLKLPCVQVVGKIPEKISAVAVCCGSGSEMAPIARQRGVDVYISAEIKHSTAIWALENNFCIIDGTHYATEKPAVALLVNKLKQAGDEAGWGIKVMQTRGEYHPFVLIDKNYQI